MQTPPDPLLIAGYVTCGTCRTDSWPVAAEWFSDTLIAVEYDWQHTYGCPYRKESGTVLLDTGAANTTIPRAPGPRICRGTTSRGTPCKSYAQTGSAFCHNHKTIRPVTR